jgi:hypothetical protein
MISLVRFIIVSNNDVWWQYMHPAASVEFGGWRARFTVIGITFVRLYVMSKNKKEHDV